MAVRSDLKRIMISLDEDTIKSLNWIVKTFDCSISGAVALAVEYLGYMNDVTIVDPNMKVRYYSPKIYSKKFSFSGHSYKKYLK